MLAIVLVAGVIHALLPIADGLVRINESAQPTQHPLIDQLDLKEARQRAAARPRPNPVPCNTLYVGGRYFERACA